MTRRPISGWPNVRWPRRWSRSCTAPRPRTPPREAADLLFSADPTAASASALEALAAEIPSSRVDATEVGDLVATLVGTGLATSNGDARRNLAQGSYSVNGVTIPENSVPAEWERLQGRYLLLRKGKKTHHLLEISS